MRNILKVNKGRTGLVDSGLPIGNLTSQHFANLYLDRLDHFIKQKLKISGYLRYMDDFVCFSDSKEHLHEVRLEIADFLGQKLKLFLKEKVTYVGTYYEGLSFLGLKIFRGTIRLEGKRRSRLFRKLKQRQKHWNNGHLDDAFFLASTGSLIEYLSCGNTFTLRQMLLS